MKRVLSISYAKRTLEIGSREYERQVALAEGLKEHVMIVFTRRSDELLPEVATGHLRVFGTNAGSTFGMLVNAWRIARWVLKESPNANWVISAQDPFATSLIAWPLARIHRSLFHLQLHGDNFGSTAWRNERFLHQILFYIGWFMLRRADKVRVVAKRQVAALMALGVPRDRITVLPVYVSLDSFLQVGKERVTLALGPLRLLYAGRFSAEKRLLPILEAVSQLHERGSAVQLTLLGSGSEEKRLRAYVEEHNLQAVVTFLPWSNDVATIYATHDMFILNSAHEGYALVLLEAAAAGLAIISTDVGCVGEVLLPDSELLLTSGTADTIAAAINRLHDEATRFALVSAAKKTAVEHSGTLPEYREAWTATF